MKFKINDIVILAWDGKICRSNVGTVTKTTQNRALIQFMYRGVQKEFWFRPYGNTRQKRELQQYCGWTDVGWLVAYKPMRVVGKSLKYKGCDGKIVYHSRIQDSIYYFKMALDRAKAHKSSDGWDE